MAVGGEGIPLLGESLVVNEITEPTEGTCAVNGPLQSLPETRFSLPLSEVSHVLPSGPRLDGIESEPPVGFGLHIDRDILTHERRIGGGLTVDLSSLQVDIATARLGPVALQLRIQHVEIDRHHGPR